MRLTGAAVLGAVGLYAGRQPYPASEAGDRAWAAELQYKGGEGGFEAAGAGEVAGALVASLCVPSVSGWEPTVFWELPKV